MKPFKGTPRLEPIEPHKTMEPNRDFEADAVRLIEAIKTLEDQRTKVNFDLAQARRHLINLLHAEDYVETAAIPDCKGGCWIVQCPDPEGVSLDRDLRITNIAELRLPPRSPRCADGE